LPSLQFPHVRCSSRGLAIALLIAALAPRTIDVATIVGAARASDLGNRSPPAPGARTIRPKPIPQGEQPAAADEPARADEPAPILEDDEEARRRAYSTGMVLIGGILITGVGLLAIVLLWGNRARRIARQPLPKVTARDELWYLKGKKPQLPNAPPSPGESPEPPK
jgi:hypothetical protein